MILLSSWAIINLILNETASKVAKVVRGIQKEFSNFDSSTENVVKRLDGAL